MGPGRLFEAFARLALSGFGGVLPFAYRALVEKRRWLEPKEFAGLVALAQVMPGPTICNLAVMIGHRFAGFAGACAALAGMVVPPSIVVVGLCVLWQRHGGVDVVRHALAGMSSVTIGLIAATTIKMGLGVFRNPSDDDAPAGRSARRGAQWALCLLGFVGVGLFRWPLAAVVAVLAPFAVALAWFADP